MRFIKDLQLLMRPWQIWRESGKITGCGIAGMPDGVLIHFDFRIQAPGNAWLIKGVKGELLWKLES